jgi:1-acyl-sn-glycerol-3-phosphate acyltransferase
MYFVIRFFTRLALKLYCNHIRVDDESFVWRKGPLILVSNHPNSFLDAVILASRLNQRVHCTAVGELTDKFLIRRLMKILHIIPVYRLHDDPSNLERNGKSFAKCVDVLLNHGIVLIFPEAVSENNWQLRPFRKIAARITLEGLKHEALKSNLKVLPVCINYNIYNRPGKMVLIQPGEEILLPDSLTGRETEKMNMLTFSLKERLSAVMLQTENKEGTIQMLISNCADVNAGKLKKIQDKLDKSETQTFVSKLIKPGFLVSRNHNLLQTLTLVCILAFPAVLGWVLNVFTYYPVKFFVKRKTSGTVYYDSVLFLILFMVYPLYWACLNIAGFIFIKNLWIQTAFLSMPLLARATMIWAENWQRIRNYFILSVKERNLLPSFFS